MAHTFLAKYSYQLLTFSSPAFFIVYVPLRKNKIKKAYIEIYLEKLTAKSKSRLQNKIEKLKEKGQKYYTPDLISKINTTKSFI